MHISTTDLEARLRQLAQSSTWLMPALRAVRELGLPSWCIGAGAVRNLVWDALHGYATPTHLPDIDVAYFDASDLTPARDADIQHRLSVLMPDTPWEVTNQAAVHHWFAEYFGHAVEPLTSLHEAVASWPEYATSVGLCLHADDSIEVIAPHGLDDLFNCVVRRNPTRVSLDTYHQRTTQKNYAARWPRVTVHTANAEY
ncbi:nucleotidyltransferase family protein [Duganella sp. sic0402]|uniref:nucleotidyltransferase family protein n=1 Tax=Duganella sp. sic0402 TaxID=2854786 RepID=UPI001E2B7085|nr:nucleotidyltransferase family protein [Duganella sp. sic0402]